MRTVSFFASACAALFLVSACSTAEPVVPPPDEPPAQDTTDVPMQFDGIVQQAGISIYMEGSHWLSTDTGETVLLESTTVDLDRYIGARVRVSGVARATVEAGATILIVDSVTVLESPSVSSAPLLEPVEEDIASSSSSEASSPLIVASSSSSKPRPPAPKSSSSKAASSKASSSTVAVAPPPAPSGSMSEQVAAMAKAVVSASTFTQPFCSRHSGFCVPLHKSWYYNSFGATSSFLWHVEVSSEDVENLGDGVLIINLVQGELDASIGDSSVREEGTFVIGYRAWTNGRHFEITAPSELRAAVAFMTENLSVYQPDMQDGASSVSSASSPAGSSSSRP